MTNSQLNTHITRAAIAATLFFVGCGPPLVVVIHDHGDGDTDTEGTEETEGTGDYTEGPEDLPVIADLPDGGDGDGACSPSWAEAVCEDADGVCHILPDSCPPDMVPLGPVGSLCIEASTGVCASMGACPDGWVDTCWPEPPAADACACVDPSPGDGDGDPAGDGDGDAYCGCGIIGAEDSFCYLDGACTYFLGGCPQGFSEICA